VAVKSMCVQDKLDTWEGRNLSKISVFKKQNQPSPCETQGKGLGVSRTGSKSD
jgi:hypothetical protein